jgi:predicted metal-dependent hydrolase
LNWRIVQAPDAVMDYVVVHELVHREHPHHRQSFWQAVMSEIPAYATHKHWLMLHVAELLW